MYKWVIYYTLPTSSDTIRNDFLTTSYIYPNSLVVLCYIVLWFSQCTSVNFNWCGQPHTSLSLLNATHSSSTMTLDSTVLCLFPLKDCTASHSFNRENMPLAVCFNTLPPLYTAWSQFSGTNGNKSERLWSRSWVGTVEVWWEFSQIIVDRTLYPYIPLGNKQKDIINLKFELFSGIKTDGHEWHDMIFYHYTTGSFFLCTDSHFNFKSNCYLIKSSRSSVILWHLICTVLNKLTRVLLIWINVFFFKLSSKNLWEAFCSPCSGHCSHGNVDGLL